MNLHFYFPVIVCFVLAKTVHNVPVRLTGGSGSHEGRLEVFVENNWGKVDASSGFGFDGNVEPRVICRQLGYQGYAFATNPDVFGNGPLLTVYDYIDCGYYFNMPRNMEECQIKKTKSPYNGKAVGVICNVTSPPQVRLVGGSGDHEGRLEVFFQGKWGSVCHNREYIKRNALNNAKVICNTLGYSEGTSVISSTQFGSGSGHVWLSELDCLGSEGYIHECVSRWGTWYPECNDHSKDISVICNVTSEPNAIRLVGGSGPHEGRVEIRYKGQWGTLRSPSEVNWRASTRSYDDNQNNAPFVICRQLGYENGESFTVSSQVFGEGSGLQWRIIEFCNGFHSFPCISRAAVEGPAPQDHMNDMGVICNVKINPKIRLVDGTSAHEGRVEISITNQWGTLCDRALTTSNQDEKEHDVTQLCHRLGYSGRDMKKPLTTKEFGNGALRNTYIYSGTCTRQTTKMTSCATSNFGDSGLCDYSKNDSSIGIACNAPTPAVPVQLVGGSGPYEGVVQVYQQGEWGSVCMNDMREWGQKEATAVCNQLGYMYRPRYDYENKRILGVNQPTSADIFGVYNRNDIKLDRVNCSSAGNDTILKDCDLGELTGSNLCNHSHDVGVVCGVRYRLPPLIRLVGGKDAYEGRLEIFFQDEWGTVCHEEDWKYDQLPSVVCDQIGVDGEKAELTRQYGPGEGRVWLERVSCEGGEPGIDSCRHAAWGAVTCDHSMDIGIKCNVLPSGLHSGVVAGIIIAVILVFIIVFVIVVIYKRKSK